MINYLYNLFIQIITFNIYNTLVLFVTIFLIFIFYNLFNFKFTFIDYKINNFIINSLFIFIYILVFIFGVLFLRYLRLGFEFDIKAFFFLLKNYLNNFSFLGIFNIILIILIFFFIIK